MEVKTYVTLTSEEFRYTYGIIAEFYSCGSGMSNTFSAKRKLLDTFSDTELEKVSQIVTKAKQWYRLNPKEVSILANELVLWKRLANYCYMAWR